LIGWLPTHMHAYFYWVTPCLIDTFYLTHTSGV
jgi:hypothetical protein